MLLLLRAFALAVGTVSLASSSVDGSLFPAQRRLATATFRSSSSSGQDATANILEPQQLRLLQNVCPDGICGDMENCTAEGKTVDNVCAEDCGDCNFCEILVEETFTALPAGALYQAIFTPQFQATRFSLNCNAEGTTTGEIDVSVSDITADEIALLVQLNVTEDATDVSLICKVDEPCNEPVCGDGLCSPGGDDVKETCFAGNSGDANLCEADCGTCPLCGNNLDETGIDLTSETQGFPWSAPVGSDISCQARAGTGNITLAAIEQDVGESCSVGEGSTLACSLRGIRSGDILVEVSATESATGVEVGCSYSPCFTESPTNPYPSQAPSQMPSRSPSPSSAPTPSPSVAPTKGPTISPSKNPTYVPSVVPSAVPTASPTVTSSALPSASPTKSPTYVPFVVPSAVPIAFPMFSPSTCPARCPGRVKRKYQAVCSVLYLFRFLAPSHRSLLFRYPAQNRLCSLFQNPAQFRLRFLLQNPARNPPPPLPVHPVWRPSRSNAAAVPFCASLFGSGTGLWVSSF